MDPSYIIFHNDQPCRGRGRLRRPRAPRFASDSPCNTRGQPQGPILPLLPLRALEGRLAALAFLAFFSGRLAQPERDKCWLHRLLYDCYELLAQRGQVHLIAQRGAEGLDDFGCMILLKA